MKPLLDESRRRALDDYQALVSQYPNLFVQRARRRLVLDSVDLAAYAAAHEGPLGVAAATPYVYFIVDLVESRHLDGTVARYPYLRVIFRGQLAGGFNVVVVPVVADASIGRIGDIILIRQERHATGRVELELPRGFAQPGLSITANALKELKEETGYLGKEAHELGATITDSGVMDAFVHYLHVPVTGRRDSDPEAREAIVGIEVLAPEEIWSQIRDGRLRDGFTLQGMALWDKFGSGARK